MIQARRCAVLIDTTMTGIGVAVSDLSSGEILWQHFDADHRGTAVLASLWISSQAQVASVGGQLACVSVSPGPGSFTGIKVGLAFVQGLRRGLDSSVVVLARSTLAALAADLKVEDPSCNAVFLAATRNRGACVSWSDGELKITDVDIAELDPRSYAGGNIYLLHHWPMLVSRFRLAGENSVLELHQWDAAKATGFAMCALAQSLAKSKYDSLVDEAQHHEGLHPQYLRASTAEEAMVLKKAMKEQKQK